MSKGVNKDVRGVRRSRGTPGGARGIMGGVRVSQEVKKGIWGVPGVEGSLGDPRGLRGTSWVCRGVKGAPRVSQGVKGNVSGVQGGQQGR